MIDGFEYELLRLLARHDVRDDLFWNILGSDNSIKFFINCSDVFWWATADLVEVTPENLPILKQAYEDAGDIYGGDLFAARVRNMQPQDPYLDRISDEKIKAHFLACGPKREPDDQEMWSPSVNQVWSRNVS